MADETEREALHGIQPESTEPPHHHHHHHDSDECHDPNCTDPSHHHHHHDLEEREELIDEAMVLSRSRRIEPTEPLSLQELRDCATRIIRVILASRRYEA